MGGGGEAPARQRVDKWLWYARFFRTRGLAAEVAGSGRLRLNGAPCQKPAQTVAPGDELSFLQGRRVRAVRVEAIGGRRGPAAEAAALYTDLDPLPPRAGPDAEGGPPSGSVPEAPPEHPGRRPDRRERREIAALRRRGP